MKWPRSMPGCCTCTTSRTASRNALERAGQRATTNHARVDEFTALRDQAGRKSPDEEKILVGEQQLAHLDEQVENFARLRRETQQRVDAEQETLRGLNEESESVESERGQMEERRAEQARIQPAAGAGTLRGWSCSSVIFRSGWRRCKPSRPF